ncbi:MAG: glycosyltransferase, partial [Pseudomonadota bacterium]|nr:glycosyltransferase [Pseudomonadota bacterium]
LMPCYDESMGVVIYEALGYGVPVIAYDSGSIGEVILDEDMGFLIDKNPQKMAELIARITVTHIKNNLMKKDLSYFSAERMVDNYLGVYNLT